MTWWQRWWPYVVAGVCVVGFGLLWLAGQRGSAAKILAHGIEQIHQPKIKALEAQLTALTATETKETHEVEAAVQAVESAKAVLAGKLSSAGLSPDEVVRRVHGTRL